MKYIAALVLVVLTGCSTVKSWIPSFSDPNQSARIIDVRASIERVDCRRPQAAQVADIQANLQWFHLYSNSKGWRQADVLRLTAPMEETAMEWYTRVSAEGYKENAVYCQLKKQTMQTQASRAAAAVLGRF
jgi:hypothetical protein